jgi:hypothetical protein
MFSCKFRSSRPLQIVLNYENRRQGDEKATRKVDLQKYQRNIMLREGCRVTPKCSCSHTVQQWVFPKMRAVEVRGLEYLLGSHGSDQTTRARTIPDWRWRQFARMVCHSDRTPAVEVLH